MYLVVLESYLLYNFIVQSNQTFLHSIVKANSANSEEFFGIFHGNRKVVKVFYDFEDQ